MRTFPGSNNMVCGPCFHSHLARCFAHWKVVQGFENERNEVTDSSFWFRRGIEHHAVVILRNICFRNFNIFRRRKQYIIVLRFSKIKINNKELAICEQMSWLSAILRGYTKNNDFGDFSVFIRNRNHQNVHPEGKNYIVGWFKGTNPCNNCRANMIATMQWCTELKTLEHASYFKQTSNTSIGGDGQFSSNSVPSGYAKKRIQKNTQDFFGSLLPKRFLPRLNNRGSKTAKENGDFIYKHHTLKVKGFESDVLGEALGNNNGPFRADAVLWRVQRSGGCTKRGRRENWHLH